MSFKLGRKNEEYIKDIELCDYLVDCLHGLNTITYTLSFPTSLSGRRLIELSNNSDTNSLTIENFEIRNNYLNGDERLTFTTEIHTSNHNFESVIRNVLRNVTLRGQFNLIDEYDTEVFDRNVVVGVSDYFYATHEEDGEHIITLKFSGRYE